MGPWEDNLWKWDMYCRRSRFVWEEIPHDDLITKLENIGLKLSKDAWIWHKGSNRTFSTNSAYWAIYEGYEDNQSQNTFARI